MLINVKYFIYLISFILSMVNFGLFIEVSYLSLSLFIVFLINFRFDFRYLLLPFCFIVLSALTLLISKHNLTDYLYFSSFLYCFNALFFVLVLSTRDRKTIQNALIYVAVVHVSILLTQHIVYIISKQYIDIHNFITFGKYISRYHSAYLNSFGLIRPTGVSIEPSNISAIINFYIVSYLIMGGEKNKLLYFSIIGNMLSFSFASILISILILIVVSISDRDLRKKKYFKYVFFAMISFLSVYALQLVYFRLTGNVDYDALAFRQQIINLIYNQKIEYHLFGHGVLMSENPFLIDNTIVYHSNIRDSGFWINLYFTGGIFIVILFLLYLYLSIKNIYFVIIVIISLCSKFDYMQPTFWLLMFIIILNNIMKKQQG